MLFAEVLLPVPIYGTFTYRVPADMQESLRVGHRVIVPFGRRKSYTGIVAALTPVEPQGYEIKDITIKIDDATIVRHPQMKFWQWVADYYLCTPGEVMKAAVPAGLKIESETFISPVAGWGGRCGRPPVGEGDSTPRSSSCLGGKESDPRLARA